MSKSKGIWVLTGRDSDDGVGDLVAEIGLSGLLHLGENHGGNFLGGEVTFLRLVLDNDGGFAVLLGDLEGPVPDVALELVVIHLATDEALSVKNGVCRI
jgi:hypothetical protein